MCPNATRILWNIKFSSVKTLPVWLCSHMFLPFYKSCFISMTALVPACSSCVRSLFYCKFHHTSEHLLLFTINISRFNPIKIIKDVSWQPYMFSLFNLDWRVCVCVLMPLSVCDNVVILNIDGAVTGPFPTNTVLTTGVVHSTKQTNCSESNIYNASNIPYVSVISYCLCVDRMMFS